MPVPNKIKAVNKALIFIDYIPAELRINKDWLIVYYAKNPVTGLLERQRVRVPKIKVQKERMQFAKAMEMDINDKLKHGWSPFLNQSGKNYKGFVDAIDDFKRNLQKQIDDEILRPDTLRTYNSNINLLLQYVEEKELKMTFALQIDKLFCVNYLDWIYLERNNSPRTRNNHLSFLSNLCNHFVRRGILAENPTNGITNLKNPPKKRVYIPREVRTKIKNEIITWNDGFYCICETIYHCFIRNTELGKMRVELLNLKENSIFIPKSISKNKKDEVITIPEDLKPILQKHIENAQPNDFLFSANKCLPGTKQMPVRKIQNNWDKLHKKIEFKKEYQFYALKDSGITDLFLMGLPAIKIRDQARHSSIEITELYTPKNMGCDESIRLSKNTF